MNINSPFFTGEESLEHRPVNMEIALFLDEVKTTEYRAVYKNNTGVIRYLVNLLNGVSAIDEYILIFIKKKHSPNAKKN